MIKELCGLNAAPPATNAWRQRPSGAHYLWKHDDDDFTSPQITELPSIQWTVWDLALLDICNHSKSRICPLLKRMWWHYYMFAYIMCLRHFLGKGNKQKQVPPPKYLLKQDSCLKFEKMLILTLLKFYHWTAALRQTWSMIIKCRRISLLLELFHIHQYHHHHRHHHHYHGPSAPLWSN